MECWIPPGFYVRVEIALGRPLTSGIWWWLSWHGPGCECCSPGRPHATVVVSLWIIVSPKILPPTSVQILSIWWFRRVWDYWVPCPHDPGRHYWGIRGFKAAHCRDRSTASMGDPWLQSLYCAKVVPTRCILSLPVIFCLAGLAQLDGRDGSAWQPASGLLS